MKYGKKINLGLFIPRNKRVILQLRLDRRREIRKAGVGEKNNREEASEPCICSLILCICILVMFLWNHFNSNPRHWRPYHGRVAGSEELREVGENVGGVAHLNLHKMI